ncbi:hypothetical protein DL96DRAFT_856702 [Flagelloscypha sp. PMI_526]|nr:hypothetical protein DL96DRAFT_856702 [Flagelloscypha sp. PMI_526]
MSRRSAFQGKRQPACGDASLNSYTLDDAHATQRRQLTTEDQAKPSKTIKKGFNSLFCGALSSGISPEDIADPVERERMRDAILAQEFQRRVEAKGIMGGGGERQSTQAVAKKWSKQTKTQLDPDHVNRAGGWRSDVYDSLGERQVLLPTSGSAYPPRRNSATPMLSSALGPQIHPAEANLPSFPHIPHHDPQSNLLHVPAPTRSSGKRHSAHPEGAKTRVPKRPSTSQGFNDNFVP